MCMCVGGWGAWCARWLCAYHSLHERCGPPPLVNQTAAMGATGAVCEAVCTKRGVLHGERFTLKTMFNMGVSNAHGVEFNQ